MIFFKQKSTAFTLLEILLVVAAIGILAAIVIVAINPQRQLGKVRDAERQSEVGTLKDGIEQYSLDKNGQYPSGIDVNTYKEVCDTEAVTPSNCPDTYVDLSGLVPEQLAAIPRDPQASDTNENTGYEVGKDENGNIAVKASNTEVDSAPKRAGTTLVVRYSLSGASYDTQTFDVSGEDGTPTGVAFNGDGTKMFMAGFSNGSVYSYNLSIAYDLGSANYNQSFDVSGEASRPTGVTFNGDGSKMFVAGASTDSVYSYNLSTAYDLGSASYTQSFDVSGEDNEPTGMTFNGDGSKMFVSGKSNTNIYSYNVSTAYDLSTASYNQTFDVSTEDSNPRGVRFNGDGTKMFMMGRTTNYVYSYNMSTAYDLGSASYNQSFDVSGEDGDPLEVTFNGDGTKMFVVGNDTDTVYSYDVSTAYDLASASYPHNFDVSGEDTLPTGVTFNGDGTKMFMMGQDTDSVYSYNLSTAYDFGSVSYNQSFDVSGEENKPSDVTFNGDGTKMFVVGYKNGNVYSYNLSTAYDLGSASYNYTFDVSGQDGGPTGMIFNENGTKMFVMGYSTDHVYSYDLSTAYDLGSASYNQKFDVSGQDNQPTGMTFNGDGTKMFVTGRFTDYLYSYNMSTAYNLGGVSYNQKLDVSGEDSDPRGMPFNGDGTKMFVVGNSNDTVYRYSSTAQE